jgi:hypothetical protein
VVNGGAAIDTVDCYYSNAAVAVSLATTAAQATGGSGTLTGGIGQDIFYFADVLGPANCSCHPH